MTTTIKTAGLIWLILVGNLVAQEDARVKVVPLNAALLPPTRLESDGKPIDTGLLSANAHASPELADVDGDGDRDLIVGDFTGQFALFENLGDDLHPRYVGRGRMHAGGKTARTPIY